jgi:hypothetical protein
MQTHVNPTTSLRADTRGAILIFGIVLGAILTGALFYLASVGDAIIWRESVQDAADAAAFENAVWNARGMNVIVSINIVMSMVLSVLVIWRIVMIAIAAAIGISALLCTIGIGCAPAATLSTIEINMLRADPRVAGAIIRTLSAINVVEMAVASAVPVLGMAASTANSRSAYSDSSPFAASASLLPNVNIQGIYNATKCLAGGKKDDGAGGSGGSSETPGGGGKPGSTGDSGKPGSTGDSGKPGSTGDSGKPGTSEEKDPCDPGGGDSAPAAAPPPSRLESASEWQNFVPMRMGMPISLPVQDGDYSLLCNKAAAFPLNNFAGAIEKALIAAGVSETLANFAVFPLDIGRNLMGVTAEVLTGVFCAPLGTAPASISTILDKSFQAVCEVEFEKTGRKRPAKGDADSGSSGDNPDAEKDTDEKFLDDEGVARTRKDWIDECGRKQKKSLDDELGGGLCATERSLADTDCGKPAEVWDWADNGNVFMRSFSQAEKPVVTRFTDSGIEAADGQRRGNVTAVEPQPAKAHAEMYFECEGECEADMWQIRWRARLRRVQPMQALLAQSAASVVSGSMEKAMKGLVSIDPVNDLVAKVPGAWTELSDFRPVTYAIEKLGDFVKDLIGPLVEPVGAGAGSVLDLFETGFDGPTNAGDLRDGLHMGEAPPPHGEDELRAFIRRHAGRNATIH